MTNTEAVKNLRHGGILDMFDRKERLFTKIQLNRQETKFVCWQRFVAKTRGNWTKWNDYLSLKDVMKIRQQIALNTQTANQ
tara:strand:+ start:617 stop:859 length:243 start_codon:yes stop_codon:yes gene_type:complete